MVKKLKSQPGPNLEFSGLAISLRDECEEVIARLRRSKGRVEKFVALVRELRVAGAACFAALRKLSWKLRFARTAVMGRFARAALKPIYELAAGGGGGLALRSFIYPPPTRFSPPVSVSL